MNALLENRIIEEMTCGTNFSYILNDNSQFLLTDYKVLQSQRNSGFVKCMKMSRNGKTELYYLSGSYKSFSALFSSINTEAFKTIVANLFHVIIEVKNNGFLSCQNIDISFDKIFIDSNTLKVNLVYIPIYKKAFQEYGIFENELRTGLVKLINTLPVLSNERIMQFATDLSNGTYSLEDLHNTIKGSQGLEKQSIISNVKQNKVMRMLAINAPIRVEIIVDKNEYTIGKNASMVDGVITFNKAISRLHCKITQNTGKFFMTDLGSANGTYINKIRLAPNIAHPIENGDSIRLANSEFQISIG